MEASFLHEEFVVVDLETTGLSPGRGSEIVETGAVRTRGGCVRETFQALSRPSAPMPEAVVRIHGITNEMLADCPPFGEVLPKLLAFIGERTVVAHNAPFDRAFLEAGLRSAGRPALANPVLDTVRLSRRLFPELGAHDLDSLCRSHGIRASQRHRALGDALVTAELLGILLERALQRGVRTREELLALGAARASGPEGSSARPDGSGPALGLELLEEAALQGEKLLLHYVSLRGKESRRVVVPYVLEDSTGRPRLLAYDVDKGQTRTFLLERIREVRRAAGDEGR